MKAIAKRPSTPVAISEPKENIFDTRTVVTTLEGLMNRVTNDDVTPDTVNAACNCADKIVDILRLHLDVERLKRRSAKDE